MRKSPNLNPVEHKYLRYESSNLVSLDQLWNFTMREVVFAGPKDSVLKNRETGRKHVRTVFDEIGLAYRVESANDPVNFASRSPSKALFN
jgi:hypothetical protein